MTLSGIFLKLSNKHFLSLAGNVAMSALSMITYAILYRVLPESDMGNWVFFQFMFALLDSLRTGFLQTALIKFYAGSSAERKVSIVGSSWYLALVITVLFVLLNIPLLFIKGVSDTGLLLFFHWFGLSLFFSLPFNVAFWILQAEEKFDKILLLRIINQGLFIIFLIAIVISHALNIRMVMNIYLCSLLLTSIISISFGWAQLKNLKNRTKAGIKEIYHFGKYSVGTYIGSTLLKSSDSIIIKFMIGPAALAIYNLAQRVADIIELLIRSFLGTAMPAMAAAFNKHDNDGVVIIMKKYAGTLMLFLIPVIVGTFFLADIFVSILGGHKYVHSEAANLLRIFVCLAITYPIDRFLGVTLDIIHKPQLNMIKVLVMLSVNVITDVLALKITGSVYGAAAASIITLLFGIGFGYFSLKKYLAFNLKGLLKLGYTESKLMISTFLRKDVHL